MNNKKSFIDDVSPGDKSLLEILNTSYLSIDDVKWLKSKKWFKRFLKIYSKELQKRFESVEEIKNNKVEVKNTDKQLLNYTKSLNAEDEVIEILDFTKTIDVTDTKHIFKANQKAKRKVKFEKKLYASFIIICIVIFIIVLYIVTRWQLDNKKTDKLSKKIYDAAEVKEKTTTKAPQDTTEQTYKSLYEKYGNMSMLDVNFNDLIKINNDTKGWIMVSGTNVNYPFVQTNNNDYYLKHSYDKTENKQGWVFLDYRNNINKLDQNNVLYAHGLVNNQMFGSLRKTLKPSWYTNKSNHIIKISTPYSSQLWQVFSCYTIIPEDYYITTSFKSDEYFEMFIDTIKDRSIYNFKVDVGKKDKILTLSSCYNDTKRMVLHAKLIEIK